jgi:hypothetical protein
MTSSTILSQSKAMTVRLEPKQLEQLNWIKHRLELALRHEKPPQMAGTPTDMHDQVVAAFESLQKLLDDLRHQEESPGQQAE